MQRLFTPPEAAGAAEALDARVLDDNDDETSEALWRLKDFHARLEVISAGKR